jgi:hypothetical protein
MPSIANYAIWGGMDFSDQWQEFCGVVYLSKRGGSLFFILN